MDELERVKKYGLMAPGSDIIGSWLRDALVGKRDFYYVDNTGTRVEKIEQPFKNPYEIRYDSNSTNTPFLDCVQEISLMWDQWVVCHIICDHNDFRGSSDFFNVTEAIMRAIVMFNDADHPAPPTEKDDENAARDDDLEE